MRLKNLDYLRGISAVAIMLYHFLSWTIGEFSAEFFMARVGLYGVSIFYILSGLTLYSVYSEKPLFEKGGLKEFFRKRFFRIYPLLWLATILTISFAGQIPNATKLALNLTGLFGFIKWDAYYAVGAWSIGNELVFYAFFPLFMYFRYAHQKLILWLLTCCTVVVFFIFAFSILNPLISIEEQWKNYINPLNQLIFFLGGLLIGYFLNSTKISNAFCIFLLILALVVFYIIPVTGDRIALVTGVNRVILTLSSLMLCIGAYKLTITLPEFLHAPLSFIGESSYSIYLLHPLIFTVVVRVLKIESVGIAIFMGFALTFLVSSYSYNYFEKYFIKIARRDTKRLLG